jgi:radical SAM-linked protein
MMDTNQEKRQTLVIVFDVTGRLRYLSHQETARMFARAMIRAKVRLGYSKGFNPRVRMSLPLPRTVGVASIGDIITVDASDEKRDTKALKAAIAEQLPDGCTIEKLEMQDGKVSYRPVSAEFEFAAAGIGKDADVKENVSRLDRSCRASERIVVERYSAKKRMNRKIDIAEYIESIEMKDDSVRAKVKITPSGSVRVNEIIELAGIAQEKVAVRITRKNVKFVS